MPDPAHEALMALFFQATTTDDYDIFDELYTEDYETEGTDVRSREALKAYFRASAGGLSEKSAELVSMVSEGDVFCARYRLRGRHTGTFAGVPASGNEVTLDSCGFFWVRDGRIARHWGSSNPLPYLVQMGALPPGWPRAAPPEGEGT